MPARLIRSPRHCGGRRDMDTLTKAVIGVGVFSLMAIAFTLL